MRICVIKTNTYSLLGLVKLLFYLENIDMKISKKIIKSYIPENYFDGSKLKGISLRKDSYDLHRGEDEFILRTTFDNPLVEILSEYFDITYNGRFYMHYHTYLIKEK